MAYDARISSALSGHPKTRKLKKRLGIPGCWSLVVMIAWAAEYRWDGNLSDLSDEDLEMAAEWEGEPGKFVKALSEVGYLDGESGSYLIHDWEQHQPYIAARGKRSAQAKHAASIRHANRQHARSIPTADTPSAPNPTQPIHNPLTPLKPNLLPACDEHAQSIPATPLSKNSNGHKPDLWQNIWETCRKIVPVEAMGEFGLGDLDHWFRRGTQVSFEGGLLRVNTDHDTVTEHRGLGKYAQWIREARSKFGVAKIEFLLDGQVKEIRLKPRPI
jgi:hypothetical protein